MALRPFGATRIFVDAVCVPFEGGEAPTAGEIPNTQRFVKATGHGASAIGGKGHACDTFRVSLKDVKALAARQIPYAQSVVRAAGHEM